MSATAAQEISVPIASLVEQYLAVLANERGASEHTLRAYQRELRGFASFTAERYGNNHSVQAIEHTHIRTYLGELYRRGLSKASAARALAATHSTGKSLSLDRNKPNRSKRRREWCKTEDLCTYNFECRRY